jgi:hypothetical protein
MKRAPLETRRARQRHGDGDMPAPRRSVDLEAGSPEVGEVGRRARGLAIDDVEVGGVAVGGRRLDEDVR